MGSDSASSSSSEHTGVGSGDESSDGGKVSAASEKVGEGGATPHASDMEMEFPDDGGAAAVAPPHADGDPAPDVGGGAPLPDPLLLAAPLWDVGVQRAEMAASGKSSCMVCASLIAFRSVRLDYQPNLSTHRFLHPGCIGGIPPAHKAHSCAVLRYQETVAVGPHMLAIIAGIEDALAHL